MLFLLVLNYVLFSQNEKEECLASSTNFGLLGGINISSTSNIGKSFSFEWKIYLSQEFSLKLSAGYYTTSVSDRYYVKTFDFVSINNIEKYYAIFYEVYAKEYQIIPLAVGIQYFLRKSIFSPYTLVEFGYNLIDPKINESQHMLIGEYNVFNELPNDYKNKHTEILPNNSYTLGLGIGTTYKISSTIDLDFRYLFKIDSEKINNHQILIGICF
jgi:hypothetical protein